jgi:hypothetical protein
VLFNSEYYSARNNSGDGVAGYASDHNSDEEEEGNKAMQWCKEKLE